MEINDYGREALRILSEHESLGSKELHDLMKPSGFKVHWKTMLDMSEDGLIEIVKESKGSTYTITDKGRRVLRMAGDVNARAPGRLLPPSTERWVPKQSSPPRAGTDSHMKLPSLGNWPKK